MFEFLAQLALLVVLGCLALAACTILLGMTYVVGRDIWREIREG